MDISSSIEKVKLLVKLVGRDIRMANRNMCEILETLSSYNKKGFFLCPSKMESMVRLGEIIGRAKVYEIEELDGDFASKCPESESDFREKTAVKNWNSNVASLIDALIDNDLEVVIPEVRKKKHLDREKLENKLKLYYQ